MCIHVHSYRQIWLNKCKKISKNLIHCTFHKQSDKRSEIHWWCKAIPTKLETKTSMYALAPLRLAHKCPCIFTSSLFSGFACGRAALCLRCIQECVVLLFSWGLFSVTPLTWRPAGRARVSAAAPYRLKLYTGTMHRRGHDIHAHEGNNASNSFPSLAFSQPWAPLYCG